MPKVDMKCYSPLLQYSDEELAKILELYDRKLENLDKDIEIIRNWEKDQLHFPIKLDDRQIVMFLIMCKFSFEKTKEKLDMFFTMRSLLPEFYTLLTNDPQVTIHSTAYLQVPLPKLTKNQHRIVCCKVIDSEQITDLRALYTHCLHVRELRTKYDVCNNDEFIIDYANVSAKLIARISPMDLKKISTILEKVYSNRISAIHLLNVPSYAEPFINIWKMTMKPKLQERYVVHKNVESLQKYYPLDYLPKDYGGNLKSIAEIREDWFQFIKENKDYIETNQLARVNENLRPTKLNNDEILGFHGNFRKLQVD